MFFSQPLHFVTHTLTNLIPLMPYTPSLGSNGPYSSVLGIHFTTRVAPTTVRRGHNNWVPKFRVDTDGETENTTTLSTARKEWLWYHKGGRRHGVGSGSTVIQWYSLKIMNTVIYIYIYILFVILVLLDQNIVFFCPLPLIYCFCNISCHWY